MLSLFRKKPRVTDETFKTRVERFWDWFGQAAPRFYQIIDSGQCSSLAEEVSKKVAEMLPGFAWVFGPGEGGKGHSFTLSGEGDPHRQLLSIYWCSRAPKLNGWTFYPSRQPGSIAGAKMQMGNLDFDPLEFWITPSVDCEREKVDLAVWHPRFDRIKEKDRWTALFLFLDEVLGEYGTQQWIGEIKLNNQQLTESMPLADLPSFIRKLQDERGWTKSPPGESGVVYRCQEPHERFLRGDVIVGSTCQPALINEYLRAEGRLDDPLEGTGADYVFVAFDAAVLPQGGESAARGVIEDALEQELRSAASGRVLGGAFGRQSAYIDLLLCDGRNSLELVQRVVREKGLQSGASINFFAKAKRGHRMVI